MEYFILEECREIGLRAVITVDHFKELCNQFHSHEIVYDKNGFIVGIITDDPGYVYTVVSRDTGLNKIASGYINKDNIVDYRENEE